MNLNRLHRIFGNDKNLSREDIQKYGQTTDESTKYSIESASLSDPFDADALEGWQEVNYNLGTLSKLDRKFKPRSYTGMYITSVVMIIAIVGSVLLWQSFTNPKSNTTELPETSTAEQEIILDESDLIIPESISKMEIAPVKEQMKVAIIKEEFKDKKVHPAKEKPIEIESLPIISLEIEENTRHEIIREHNHASEIYLHELKLVDYTKYRSKPTVKTKQVVLTGTPANKENEHSEEMDPIWKEVDVPYIEYLSKSMKVFGKGQYKRSLARFETIIATYPMDVNANFYGGLCLYNLGEYEKGIELFNKCILGPYSNFDEEAQWLIALSHEQLGQHDQAQKIFRSIVDQRGFYKDQAKKKLK